MITPPRPGPDGLAEFVRGKLSPEESSVILDQLEIDPELSRELEFVLAFLSLKSEGREVWQNSRSPE